MKTIKTLINFIMVVILIFTLSACGNKETIYTMSIDTDDVLKYNDLYNPTLKASYDATNGQTELQYTLTITTDGKDKYIMEKTLKSSGENDELNIDVQYTYTGTYSKSENELALNPAEFVSIDNDWGTISNFVGFHDGKATSDDFDSLFRGGASLYLTTYGHFGITVEVNDNNEIVNLVNIYDDTFVETEYIITNPVEGYEPIYGKLVLPKEFTGKIPMVSIAHGMNRSYKDKVYNARAYAAAGIGSYVFNYDSGRASFDECLQEVKAAFEAVKALDFTDTDNIFLSGYSYGGMLSSLLAGQRATVENDIRGIILVYPGLVSTNNFEQLTPFEGSVLILQGDEDSVISIDNVYAAVDAYGDNAELVIIEGGQHGKFMKFEEICFPTMIEFINDAIQ